MPDSYALETTRYEDWTDFRGRLERLTDAVAQAIHPGLEQRVGVRYVDRINHPEVLKPADWRDWIQPPFLGPLSHKVLGDAVRTTQQIVELDMGDDVSIILRHGAVPDPDTRGEWIYLIDQDCYVQRGRAFEAKDVLEVAERLHTVSLQVFQQAITPELYDYLKGDPS